MITIEPSISHAFYLKNHTNKNNEGVDLKNINENFQTNANFLSKNLKIFSVHFFV